MLKNAQVKDKAKLEETKEKYHGTKLPPVKPENIIPVKKEKIVYQAKHIPMKSIDEVNEESNQSVEVEIDVKTKIIESDESKIKFIDEAQIEDEKFKKVKKSSLF